MDTQWTIDPVLVSVFCTTFICLFSRDCFTSFIFSARLSVETFKEVVLLVGATGDVIADAALLEGPAAEAGGLDVVGVTDPVKFFLEGEDTLELMLGVV